jgi:hypothetical protein
MNNSRTTTFTATGSGLEVTGAAGDGLAYSLSGTFVATVVLEAARRGGWQTLLTLTTASSGTLPVEPASGDRVARYRWRCPAFTSGTITAALDTTGSKAIVGLPRLRQARVELSHAQILTLPTTPVEILPATDANRLYLVTGWALRLDGGSAYGGMTAAVWTLNYTHGGATAASEVNPGDFSNSLFRWGVGPGWYNEDTSSLGAGGNIFDPELGGTPVLLRDDWSAGAYTDGAATNRAVVTVAYLLYNVITGLFE